MADGLAWATKKGEPMPIVSYHGLEQWRSECDQVNVMYERVPFEENGKPMYRCCVLPDHRNEIYLLVETHENRRDLFPVKLAGIAAVHAHHVMHGDGGTATIRHEPDV